MANRYFDPGQERAAKVKALFARIAARYDLLNDLQSFGWHRYWKRRLLRLARPRSGEHGLDVCCGTGDLTLALAGAGVNAVGLDFSGPMLEVALKRRQHAGRTWSEQGRGDDTPFAGWPQFVRGDAQNLPFKNQVFEVVTVGYGLRNLADWKRGLGEMQRVMRAGGRLLVLDFGKPENALWRSLYFGYLRLFVPVLGRIFSGSASAYGYILESLKHYPAQHGVAAALQELGFRNIRIIRFLGGVMTINYAENAAPGERRPGDSVSPSRVEP